MKTAKAAATSSALADRYIRHEDFAERIHDLALSPEIWAVFAQLARPRTAAELARQLKLNAETVNTALRRLVRRKLVRKHVLAWRDYAAAVTPSSAPATSTHFEGSTAPFREMTPLVAKKPAATPEPHRAPSAPAPGALLSPIISFRVSSSRAPARPAPAVSLRIGSSALPAKTTPGSTANAPRLRPILDAIGAKAGGGVAGQLLVYRVFLQIPTELMHAAGLHSLNLVDDHYTIAHSALRAALAAAARRHAGVDIDALLTTA